MDKQSWNAMMHDARSGVSKLGVGGPEYLRTSSTPPIAVSQAPGQMEIVRNDDSMPDYQPITEQSRPVAQDTPIEINWEGNMAVSYSTMPHQFALVFGKRPDQGLSTFDIAMQLLRGLRSQGEGYNVSLVRHNPRFALTGNWNKDVQERFSEAVVNQLGSDYQTEQVDVPRGVFPIIDTNSKLSRPGILIKGGPRKDIYGSEAINELRQVFARNGSHFDVVPYSDMYALVVEEGVDNSNITDPYGRGALDRLVAQLQEDGLVAAVTDRVEKTALIIEDDVWGRQKSAREGQRGPAALDKNKKPFLNESGLATAARLSRMGYHAHFVRLDKEITDSSFWRQVLCVNEYPVEIYDPAKPLLNGEVKLTRTFLDIQFIGHDTEAGIDGTDVARRIALDSDDLLLRYEPEVTMVSSMPKGIQESAKQIPPTIRLHYSEKVAGRPYDEHLHNTIVDLNKGIIQPETLEGIVRRRRKIPAPRRR